MPFDDLKEKKKFINSSSRMKASIDFIFKNRFIPNIPGKLDVFSETQCWPVARDTQGMWLCHKQQFVTLQKGNTKIAAAHTVNSLPGLSFELTY